MATGGSERVIVLFHGCAETRSNRFLTHTKMSRPLNQVLHKQVKGTLLQTAALQHHSVQRQPFLPIRGFTRRGFTRLCFQDIFTL